MNEALARLKQGARALGGSLEVLRQAPQLWVLGALPALLHLALLGVAVWVAWVPTAEWMAQREAPPEVLMPLYRGIGWMVQALVFVAGVLLATGLASVLSAPLLELLAWATESHLDQTVLPRPGFKALVASLGRRLAALGLWTMAQTLAAFFNVFPVLGGLIELTSGVGVSALYLARELTDAPLARRGLGLRAQLALLRAQPGPFAGLGLSAGALVGLPLINLVAFPAAAVAGVLLVRQLEAEGRLPRSPAPGTSE